MKFSGYYFYINTNIQGDFQISVSLPLNYAMNSFDKMMLFLFQNKIQLHRKTIIHREASNYSIRKAE